jgi:ribonuclease P protein component
VHLILPNAVEEPARADQLAARAGFVVARAVGGAVVRHQVKRRLRHLVRDRLAGLPGGARLVVRALPAAAGRSYQELGHDLDAALAGATRGRGR